MNSVPLNDKRVIFGWVMYDWANSVYFLVISTAIFPIYYTAVSSEHIMLFGDEFSTSVLYKYVVTFSYILVAFVVPLLSGVADYGGRRKFFLKLFTVIGALACAGLYLYDSPETYWIGVGCFALATIGAGAGIAFYNAYLPEIVTEDQYDKVSARGYSYGYAGSVILLVLCLVMIQKPEWFGFSDTGMPTRISFILVGIWWLGFAQITFRRLPQDKPVNTTGLLTKGFNELQQAWKGLRQQRRTLMFLAAALCYMAGVQTVIYLATIFADVEMDMGSAELIVLILILQLLAIVGAMLFARVSDRWGNKASLMSQVLIWMLICLAAYFVRDKIQFYVIAVFVGMVLGGIQSLSRATYAKFLESKSGDLTSYFSFYDFMMKISLAGGAFIFGFVEQLTGGMRNSVLALMILFALGAIILSFIDMKGMKPEKSY